MKNYIITVNGTAYEVTVEENENGAAAAPAAPKAASMRTGSFKKIRQEAPVPVPDPENGRRETVKGPERSEAPQEQGFLKQF